MSLDFRRMSRQELQFVRQYSIALKQHFAVFVSALNMMRATELDLQCPVAAARVAGGLNVLHAEFEQTLAEVIKHNGFRLRATDIEHPTLDEMTQVIQISFFKLVESSKGPQIPEDLGWFSGHPLDWQTAWAQAHKSDTSGPASIASAIINALANLFSVGYAHPADEDAYEEPDEDDDWYEQDDYENY